jgi:hypothetical protein
MQARVQRGFKLLLSNKDPNFNYLLLQFPRIRKVYQKIFKTILSLQIAKYKKFSIILEDGTELKHTEFRDKYCKQIFESCGFDKKTITLQKELIAFVMKSVRSYLGRNKTAIIPKLSFKGGAINFSETSGYKDGKLKLTTINGSIKIDIHKVISKYPLKNMSRVGGNLILKIKKGRPIIIFGGYVEKLEDVAYDPVDFIAYDINKDKRYYLTFHDETIIQRGEEIDKILAVKNLLNTIIKPPKVSKEIYDKYKTAPISVKNVKKEMQLIEEYNPVWAKYIWDKINKGDEEYFCIISRQRRNVRGYQQRAYKHIKKLLRKIAIKIVESAEAESKGLAIDSITTGQKMSEYGQCISKIVIEECRRRKIPYYTIPSAYTTLTCNKCGNKDKKNKVASDEFLCVKCGHKTVTHFNAAKNIHDFAVELFENECIYGIQDKRSISSIIKSNKEIQTV